MRLKVVGLRIRLKVVGSRTKSGRAEGSGTIGGTTKRTEGRIDGETEGEISRVDISFKGCIIMFSFFIRFILSLS